MLTIYDLDNPKKLKTVLSAIMRDKGFEDITYKNVSGGQDTTFLVNDSWIVKVGLHEDDYFKFDDQRDLIAKIRPYMTSVELPRYEAQDFKIESTNGDWNLIHAARYPKMDGAVLDSFDDLNALPRENRDLIMKSLARVAADLHSIPIEQVEEFFPYSPRQKVMRCLASLRPDFYEMDKRRRDLMTGSVMQSVYPGMEFCFCHRDLRPQNFCLSEDMKRIEKVFDFGCAEIDLPQSDVAAYVNNAQDTTVLRQEYERLTGRRLSSFNEQKARVIIENTQNLLPRVKKALMQFERTK